jgi:hypothetical protein
MAIAIINRLPEGVGAEQYDAIQGQLNLESDPPDGLLFHSAAELDGGFQVIDVWESRDDYERFRVERLRPAMVSAMGEELVAAMPDATPVEGPVHNYEIPRRG